MDIEKILYLDLLCIDSRMPTKYVCHWNESYDAHLQKKTLEGKYYNVAITTATNEYDSLIDMLIAINVIAKRPPSPHHKDIENKRSKCKPNIRMTYLLFSC